MVQYKYDAWGRPIGKTGSIASTLGTVQPFRYRGYVYDEETGLYYLQTRYYSPENVRFLNADVLLSTGQGLLGNNIFAYCRNNPVRRKDTFGTTEVDILDDDPDLLDDDKSIAGGKAGSGGGSGRAGTHSISKTTVAGGPHGNPKHFDAIRKKIESLIKSGQNMKIWGNCKLKTAGLVGDQKPDIITRSWDGNYDVWEFASRSQATGIKGYYVLREKIEIMQTANPNVRFHFITWEEIR